MSRSLIPDFYSRLWYDHCRLKFVKIRIKILWFGMENSQVCIKNTTAIRYCSEIVPIEPFPVEFIPTPPFSIRLWSDLYLSYGKKQPTLSQKCPYSVPIFPNEIRQWTDSGGKIWTRSKLNRQLIISSNLTRLSRQRPDQQDTVQTPSRQHRTLLGFWSDTAESVPT